MRFYKRRYVNAQIHAFMLMEKEGVATGERMGAEGDESEAFASSE